MYVEVFLEKFNNGYFTGFGTAMKDSINFTFHGNDFQLKKNSKLVDNGTNRLLKTPLTYMGKPVYIEIYYDYRYGGEHESKELLGHLYGFIQRLMREGKELVDDAFKEVLLDEKISSLYKNINQLKKDVTLKYTTFSYRKDNSFLFDMLFEIDNPKLIEINGENLFSLYIYYKKNK